MTEEKVRLLRAMGQSTKPEIIKNTLKFIFEGVREINYFTVYRILFLKCRIMFACKIQYQVLLVVHQVAMVEI
jgi:hypothetical protein